MADARPLVVLGGPIHADALALLETEARVVVTKEETEAGFVGVRLVGVECVVRRRVKAGIRVHAIAATRSTTRAISSSRSVIDDGR